MRKRTSGKENAWKETPYASFSLSFIIIFFLGTKRGQKAY